MKKRAIPEDTLNRIIKFLAIGLLGLAILFMMIQFNDFWKWIADAISAVIVPVTTGYLIALILFPLIRYLEKKGIGPRGLSLAIVFLIAIGLVFSFFFFIGPLIIQEITNFFNNDFNMITAYFSEGLRDDFILGPELYDQVAQYVAETDLIGSFLNGLLPSLVAYLSNVLVPMITVVAILPVMLIYYLKDYENIAERLRSIIPPKHEKNVADLGSRLNQTIGAFLRGQLLLMVAIGSVATIVYKLIGLEYFFVFGLIVGITNIIPYFGSIIAVIPPVIYAAITTGSGGPGPIIIIIVNIVLQFVEGNIFQPIIMSHQLEMHPLIIIISIFFFGSLFGLFGVVFASPIAASIRVLIQFFKERRKEKDMTLTSPGSGSG
ncbi:MAG: AI-2E family transporter [Candidatus Izemoplasmatales bacterium]|nr:AI-2E family transporter [bacterium]MDZ4196034.1 AI-2E family transporter [Candidatus Izemoplasmatales bacterium]